jgi:hypothetical protein
MATATTKEDIEKMSVGELRIFLAQKFTFTTELLQKIEGRPTVPSVRKEGGKQN